MVIIMLTHDHDYYKHSEIFQSVNSTLLMLQFWKNMLFYFVTFILFPLISLLTRELG